MEYDKIKQLMEDMGNSKLSSIDIDFPDGTKISMKKELLAPNVVITSNDRLKKKMYKLNKPKKMKVKI